VTILHYLGALDSHLTHVQMQVSPWLFLIGLKRREDYNRFIQLTVQPLSIPMKPLRGSGSELGAGDVVLAGPICFTSSLSRRHGVGVVEEKVVGTTIFGGGLPSGLNTV